jgi:uncharacterized protein
VLAKIREAGAMVRPTKTIAISPDEPDNRFLECSEAAVAAYLVTGNARHFPKSHKATVVVNARRLLALLAAPEE